MWFEIRSLPIFLLKTGVGNITVRLSVSGGWVQSAGSTKAMGAEGIDTLPSL